ncbi:unnamed protein product [Fusarium graminearum]|nr:unnamed protein product [Fusarium graminearum]
MDFLPFHAEDRKPGVDYTSKIASGGTNSGEMDMGFAKCPGLLIRMVGYSYQSQCHFANYGVNSLFVESTTRADQKSVADP